MSQPSAHCTRSIAHIVRQGLPTERTAALRCEHASFGPPLSPCRPRSPHLQRMAVGSQGILIDISLQHKPDGVLLLVRRVRAVQRTYVGSRWRHEQQRRARKGTLGTLDRSLAAACFGELGAVCMSCEGGAHGSIQPANAPPCSAGLMARPPRCSGALWEAPMRLGHPREILCLFGRAPFRKVCTV